MCVICRHMLDLLIEDNIIDPSIHSYYKIRAIQNIKNIVNSYPADKRVKAMQAITDNVLGSHPPQVEVFELDEATAHQILDLLKPKDQFSPEISKALDEAIKNGKIH